MNQNPTVGTERTSVTVLQLRNNNAEIHMSINHANRKCVKTHNLNPHVGRQSLLLFILKQAKQSKETKSHTTLWTQNHCVGSLRRQPSTENNVDADKYCE